VWSMWCLDYLLALMPNRTYLVPRTVRPLVPYSLCTIS
jgi:hypothetical protein